MDRSCTNSCTNSCTASILMKRKINLSPCTDIRTGTWSILSVKEMILIKYLKIALFGFVVCVMLTGCTHTSNAPETYGKTESPTETPQPRESKDVNTAEMQNESATTITTAPESIPTPTPHTSTSASTPTPTPSQEHTPIPVPTPAPTTEPTPEQVTYTYSVWAESGAVITAQDSATGEFHYKQKCEACGEVKNGATLSYVRGGNGLTSSFTCSKCGNHQKVVIGWSCTRN